MKTSFFFGFLIGYKLWTGSLWYFCWQKHSWEVRWYCLRLVMTSEKSKRVDWFSELCNFKIFVWRARLTKPELVSKSASKFFFSNSLWKNLMWSITRMKCGSSRILCSYLANDRTTQLFRLCLLAKLWILKLNFKFDFMVFFFMVYFILFVFESLKTCILKFYLQVICFLINCLDKSKMI